MKKAISLERESTNDSKILGKCKKLVDEIVLENRVKSIDPIDYSLKKMFELKVLNGPNQYLIIQEDEIQNNAKNNPGKNGFNFRDHLMEKLNKTRNIYF